MPQVDYPAEFALAPLTIIAEGNSPASVLVDSVGIDGQGYAEAGSSAVVQ